MNPHSSKSRKDYGVQATEGVQCVRGHSSGKLRRKCRLSLNGRGQPSEADIGGPWAGRRHRKLCVRFSEEWKVETEKRAEGCQCLHSITVPLKSKTEAWGVLGTRKPLDTSHLLGPSGSMTCWALESHSVGCKLTVFLRSPYPGSYISHAASDSKRQLYGHQGLLIAVCVASWRDQVRAIQQVSRHRCVDECLAIGLSSCDICRILSLGYFGPPDWLSLPWQTSLYHWL